MKLKMYPCSHLINKVVKWILLCSKLGIEYCGHVKFKFNDTYNMYIIVMPILLSILYDMFYNIAIKVIYFTFSILVFVKLK